MLPVEPWAVKSFQRSVPAVIMLPVKTWALRTFWFQVRLANSCRQSLEDWEDLA